MDVGGFLFTGLAIVYATVGIVYVVILTRVYDDGTCRIYTSTMILRMFRSRSKDETDTLRGAARMRLAESSRMLAEEIRTERDDSTHMVAVLAAGPDSDVQQITARMHERAEQLMAQAEDRFAAALRGAEAMRLMEARRHTIRAANRERRRLRYAGLREWSVPAARQVVTLAAKCAPIWAIIAGAVIALAKLAFQDAVTVTGEFVATSLLVYFFAPLITGMIILLWRANSAELAQQGRTAKQVRRYKKLLAFAAPGILVIVVVAFTFEVPMVESPFTPPASFGTEPALGVETRVGLAVGALVLFGLTKFIVDDGIMALRPIRTGRKRIRRGKDAPRSMTSEDVFAEVFQVGIPDSARWQTLALALCLAPLLALGGIFAAVLSVWPSQLEGDEFPPSVIIDAILFSVIACSLLAALLIYAASHLAAGAERRRRYKRYRQAGLVVEHTVSPWLAVGAWAVFWVVVYTVTTTTTANVTYSTPAELDTAIQEHTTLMAVGLFESFWATFSALGVGTWTLIAVIERRKQDQQLAARAGLYGVHDPSHAHLPRKKFGDHPEA